MKGKLARIERDIEVLEAKGLEDSEEYRILSEEADQIAITISKKEIEQSLASEARAYERRLEALKTRIGYTYGNYDDWLKWAMSLYTIHYEDREFVLKSKAKDWDKAWVFSQRIDCLEKIEQLIDYKEYDHFVRARKAD